jgi:hypothetical protein
MSDDYGDYAANQAKLRRVMRRYERMQAAKAKGTHDKREWSALAGVFGRCVVCNTPYEEMSGGSPTKDHIELVALGGCDCIANIQPACRQCNSRGIGEDLRSRAIPGWSTLFLHRMGVYF